MSPQPLDDFSTLPVPEDDVSLTISTGDVSTIWRESNLTSVSGNSVASEALLSVLTESVGRVDENLVVERLSGKVLFCKARAKATTRLKFSIETQMDHVRKDQQTAWVDGDGWHRVHIGLSNVLDNDGNVVVPSSNTLVVRGSDEPSVFVDESDGVDGAEMLVVLLRDLVRVGIVL